MQKKSLGQVFLKDQNVLDRIITNAQITSSDIIVEIGCGEGVLSERCAALAKKLYIIEIDPYFLNQTRERLKQYRNIEYILGDVLEVGFEAIQEDSFKMIANVPYYISAKIVKLIIQNRARIHAAYLMFQKEFAQKLIAKPNTELYTSLTIHAEYYLDSRYLFTVSKNSFFPRPKIDSAVICITPKESLPFEVNELLFFNIVRSAFWGRRKTLLNCLLKSPYLSLNPKFKEIPFFQKNPDIRGETLSLQQFGELYQELAVFW